MIDILGILSFFIGLLNHTIVIEHYCYWEQVLACSLQIFVLYRSFYTRMKQGLTSLGTGFVAIFHAYPHCTFRR
jgi:hypothetical protein